ncbi:MAG TPA: hypothetical protein DIS96_01995 [Pusillimonas sp.]|nr:hypothetical protein [Pusillimonas sp.]
MDTTKWKSILATRKVYSELAALSRIEGRTISGQLRLIFEAWKQENLSKRDLQLLQSEVEAAESALLN